MNDFLVTKLDQIDANVRQLQQKVDNLETTVTTSKRIISGHPVMFIIVLVGFFITMDFWAVAAHKTVNYLHPKGKFTFWEYIIIAMIALGLLLWIANSSGVKIQFIEGSQ